MLLPSTSIIVLLGYFDLVNVVFHITNPQFPGWPNWYIAWNQKIQASAESRCFACTPQPHAVILFSKLNQIRLGYFDPFNIVFHNMTTQFSRWLDVFIGWNNKIKLPQKVAASHLHRNHMRITGKPLNIPYCRYVFKQSRFSSVFWIMIQNNSIRQNDVLALTRAKQLQPFFRIRHRISYRGSTRL